MARELEDQFDLFNKTHFFGRLPSIPVRWSEKPWTNDEYGHLFYYPETLHDEKSYAVIYLAKSLKGMSEVWHRALLHEMAHWKLRRYLECEPYHGYRFKKEMRRLRNRGAFDDLL